MTRDCTGATGALHGVDPTGLEGLRKKLVEVDPDGRLLPIGMTRIEAGPNALDSLPALVCGLASNGRVAVAGDPTFISDGEGDLKAGLAEMLSRHLGGGFEVERVTLGSPDHPLHADEATLDEATEAVEGAACVVVVGSGTVTDVCKVATARAGDIPLVAVQTAASVNGFTDDLSVTLKAGAKRTVKSRWPDALIMSSIVLSNAPHEMTAAGFGDAVAMYTGPADWYLAHALGQDDSFHSAALELVLGSGPTLLEDAEAIARDDPEAVERLAGTLAVQGLAIGVSGTTAALSGTEHLVSHMLDMEGMKSGRDLAFHGAQVGAASVVVAALWEEFVSGFDPSNIDLDSCYPGDEEASVRAAFVGLDPSGALGGECWNDYAKKLERWSERRDSFEAFLSDWEDHRRELARLVVSPEALASALRRAGAPVRFSELKPAVGEETVRWAISDCHRMRNRFTVVDLLYLASIWDEDFVDRVLERAARAGGGL